MRIEISLRTCVRSGQCSYLHAELFDRDSEDFPASTVEHPGEEHRAAIEDAMELCPTSSISLMEDGGSIPVLDRGAPDQLPLLAPRADARVGRSTAAKG